MLDKLTTEARNPHTINLDEMSTLDILRIMNQEDESALQAVEEELPNIEKAVKLTIRSFKNNGRLIYVGAGTSGRLGVLDAVECVPTFGTEPEMVQGIMAGGMKALYQAAEGVEDDRELGANDLKNIQLSENDTVIGIAASGRTPYVIGALEYANLKNASTVSISCNKDAAMSAYGSVAIELVTGAEVLTGSTRLKAGTAQKMVLNMISTAAMVGIGKVYQNFMVDLKPTNEKLLERSKRNIMEITGVDYETANTYFEKSRHQVKVAIIMILLQCSFEEAVSRLEHSDGFVRRALAK
ncbi:N-acetylmuramic acid 6-phosphate etherase [Oceanobacillus indicireducens]|uniref:N-acetylmuramic acid 6-phosphate etherase n=1 Tax=Oceanobacillus indicireducens TaxID=1004261 RepID=A0A918D4Z6_9BACI|nr:N-acetylmuramic acid 6-phosphate etherase [Oceanobacillus indicireducens]GGN66572.1 N-acetylmuramic acid 6-phosphate etherase [Oceanobacillus indicireducens]